MKIFVERNILVKGRAGMFDFVPPYSATVVERVLAAGAQITGSMNEADAFLGTTKAADYGYYIKPTYGTVSRFGVIAHASSMDQVGISAHELDTVFHVLRLIAGHDKNDGTSLPQEKYDYAPPGHELKIAGFGEFDAEAVEAVYMIISASEFSGNVSRFDGMKFGYRHENYKNADELVINTRSACFSPEMKLHALMGAYVLSEGQFERYYLKATKVRRIIKQGLERAFESADAFRVPDMTLAYLTGCPALIMPDGACYITREGQEGNFYGI